jgi:ATP-binding cassette subfamily B protein/subfamily B ATP-binding cassette protein MsbA
MAMKESLSYKLKRLMPYIWRERRTLAVILLLTLLGAATAALMPWPLKILVDYALGGAELPQSVIFVPDYFSPSLSPLMLITAASVASLGLFWLSSALDVAQTWSWSAMGQRMVYTLASGLFNKLLRLSPVFHSKNTVGDSVSRLTTDTWCVYPLTQGLLIAPMQSVFTLLFIGSLAWQMDAGLTLLALVVSPVLAVLAVFFGNRLRQRARQSREAQSSVTAFVHQILSVLPIVQAFGTERYNRDRFTELSKDAVSRSQRSVLLRSGYGLVNGLTMTAGAAIVLFAGGQRVLAETLSVGSLLVFVAYVASLQRAVESLLNTYGNLKTAEASMDRLLDVLDSDEEIQDKPGAIALPKPRPGRCGEIVFDQVTFGYEPGNPVLHDISFEAKSGETIAIVGRTGAGKSTLVSLIPRFFDPLLGRVMFDGLDIRDIQLASLRSQVSLVLQDPFLFPMTVAENIAFGCPEASRAAVIAAAVSANADEFIKKLPQGYDTPLTEGGSTLSGGQKQRLSIARALLRDTPILILDEPTSALDTETESLLLNSLQKLAHGRTTFVIAHRLSTIRNADRIVALENGAIAEIGTHRELIVSGGPYSRFHSLQGSDSVSGELT